MKARMFMLGMAVLAATGCASRTVKLAPVPIEPVSLSGQWVVDPSRTEDASAKVRLLAKEKTGGKGGGSGAAADMSARIRDAGDSVVSMLDRQGFLPDQLDVEQKPRAVRRVADGQPITVPITPDGSEGPVRAGWHGGTFVVEIHGQGKAVVTQRFTRAAAPDRLTVVTETRMGKGDLVLVRVFMPRTGA